MIAICKHFILLLMFLLMVDATIGLVDATGHRFLHRYLPEVRKSRGHREVTTGHGRGCRSQLKAKNSFKTEKNGNNTEVVAQTGTTAVLDCQVRAKNVTVIWVKKIDNEEIILLTVNNNTHTKDRRFYATNDNDPQVWSLHIRYADNTDMGIYECQVCTHPTSSIYVKLSLVEAYADIFGGSNKVVKAGSPLRLSCILKCVIEPPTYIFWYFSDKMINYNLGGGAAVRHGRLGSELIFPSALPEHAGNYTCVPSNARQVSVTVDVEQGSENPAAMQHGSKSASSTTTCRPRRDHIVNMLPLVLTCFLRR